MNKKICSFLKKMFAYLNLTLSIEFLTFTIHSFSNEMREKSCVFVVEKEHRINY